MKKKLILFMVVGLVALFGLNNSASAETKMMFNGEYRFVGVSADNVYDGVDTQDDGTYSDELSFVMQRLRLNTIAATENVKGILGFEIGWDEWGKSYGILGKGGVQAGGDSGIMADYNAANAEVRLAYIDFTVPDTKLSLSVGKQPLFTHQHLIILGAAMSPGIQANYALSEAAKIKVWWAKIVEGTNALAPDWVGNGDSDNDVYYAEFSNKTEAMNWGVYGAYNRDFRETGGPSIRPMPMANYDVTTQWFGAFAGLNVGPVKLDLHGAYGTWDFTAARGATDDWGGTGYYFRVMAFMKTGIGLLNAGTLYASGDSDMTDKDFDVFPYVEGGVLYPFISAVVAGPNILYWGNGVADEVYTQTCLPPSGVDHLGRWFTNVGLTIPKGKTKFIGELWYLRTAEDPTDPKTFGATFMSDEMGYELDFELHYAMTKNLTLQAEFDYLMAGDYFAKSADIGPDSAYIAAWGIKYAF